MTASVVGLEVEDPAGDNSSDTFVHFELATAVDLDQGSNTLSIDNPDTPDPFAPADTVVNPGTRVWFRADATTSYSPGMSSNPLMNRVWFDIASGELTRTAYWNPRVIRTNPYATLGPKRTHTEIATPSDASDNTGRISSERRVIVQEVSVASVEVSPASATLTGIDNTLTLTATLRDASGTVLTGRQIEWSSSDTTVATVAGDGETVTVTSRANGTATITATSEGVSGSATVTVAVDPFANLEDCTGITETGPMGTLPDGTVILELRFVFDCPESDQGNAAEHRWTFGDGDETQWMSGSTEKIHEYTGPANYLAKIEAREIADPSAYESAEFPIEVPDAPVASVSVTPASANLEVGETMTLLATLRDQEGNVLSGRDVTWTKSNSKVSLSSSGNEVDVTGVADGSVTVTATSEGVSGSSSITVDEPPPAVNDATAGNNSFPAAMAQGQFYAVSLVMTNLGGTTWRDADGYSLRRVSGGFDWIPGSVGLGSSSISPGTSKTFQFNLYNEGVVDQTYDVYYRMTQSGSGDFGQLNGRQITVLDPSTCTKNCGPSAFMWPTGGVPGGSFGSGRGAPDSAAEVIQRLVVDGYSLHFIHEGDEDVAYIRYFAALAEDWPVDVEFDLTFDSQSVSLGQTRRGLQAPDYEVEIEQEGPDRVKIRLKRVDINAALTGEGLILEIPIVAKPNKPLPDGFQRVELTISR